MSDAPPNRATVDDILPLLQKYIWRVNRNAIESDRSRLIFDETPLHVFLSRRQHAWTHHPKYTETGVQMPDEWVSTSSSNTRYTQAIFNALWNAFIFIEYHFEKVLQARGGELKNVNGQAFADEVDRVMKKTNFLPAIKQTYKDKNAIAFVRTPFVRPLLDKDPDVFLTFTQLARLLTDAEWGFDRILTWGRPPRVVCKLLWKKGFSSKGWHRLSDVKVMEKLHATDPVTIPSKKLKIYESETEEDDNTSLHEFCDLTQMEAPQFLVLPED